MRALEETENTGRLDIADDESPGSSSYRVVGPATDFLQLSTFLYLFSTMILNVNLEAILRMSEQPLDLSVVDPLCNIL